MITNHNQIAVISSHGTLTYGDLDGHASRLARLLLDRGFRSGDGVALALSNRPEYAEVLWACERAGFWFIPINQSLSASEMAHILKDSEAKAFITEAKLKSAVESIPEEFPGIDCFSIGPLPGFEDYHRRLKLEDAEPFVSLKGGGVMRYTSGTTGYPKGVRKPPNNPETEKVRYQRQPSPMVEGESVVLVNGPLYHAAPLKFDLAVPLKKRATIVMTDKWDAENTLRLIEHHKVTHMHMVPTMFERLLSLPEDKRVCYDLSSLRQILHGAAPISINTKRAMIDWLGPIFFEYYGGSEGGGTDITTEEWLKKPGSVGKPWVHRVVEILDDQGSVLPPHTVGHVYFRTPEEGAFHYHNDPEKTQDAYKDGRFTIGDQGYLDADGYLFLTGRTSEVIIAGGVNIYPAEIDSVLIQHKAVADVATVGIPHPVYGEEVKAVVELKDLEADEALLREELLAYCREHLAKFKCPRSIDFVESIPRSAAGKIMRQEVRKPYWSESSQQI